MAALKGRGFRIDSAKQYSVKVSAVGRSVMVSMCILGAENVLEEAFCSSSSYRMDLVYNQE